MTNQMRIARHACLAALALGAACAHAPSQSEGRLKAADYYPLAVGNQWVYAAGGGEGGGQAPDQTVTITGVKDGYFVDDAKGAFRVDEGGVRDQKRYLLADPLEKGKTWTSIVTVASTERSEVADVGFVASTPAGSFRDCVKIRSANRIDRDKELVIEWTYAPGVGIVRFARTLKERGKEIPQGTVELKSYKLAPVPAR